jgi:hypothetical protein
MVSRFWKYVKNFLTALHLFIPPKTTGTFTPVHSAGYLILRNELRSTQEVARQNIQVSFYIRSMRLLTEYLNTCVTIFGNKISKSRLSLLISGIICFNLLKNKIFKIKIWSLASENTWTIQEIYFPHNILRVSNLTYNFDIHWYSFRQSSEEIMIMSGID